jgi:hypothetical protein
MCIICVLSSLESPSYNLVLVSVYIVVYIYSCIDLNVKRHPIFKIFKIQDQNQKILNLQRGIT